MDDPLLWLGTIACALLAAAGLLPLERRHRLLALSAAVVLAPLLVAAANWDSERFVELRDSPAQIVAVVAIAAVVIAALAVLFARRPRLLPLLAVATLPFRVPVELGGTTSNLLLPLYAVIAAGLLAVCLRDAPAARPTAVGPWRWIGPALAAVLVLYALQAGHSDDLGGAVENIAFFFAPFSALLVLLGEVEWDRSLLRATFAVLLVEALLVALVGFGQYATRELFWNEKVIAGNEAHSWFRVNSLFWDPNIMGRYLAVVMVGLAAVAGWASSARNAALATTAFAVLLVALLITFSQSSLLALLAGLLVLVAVRWGLWRGALVAVATVAAVFASSAIGGGVTGESSGRTGLVRGGLEIAADHPLVGAGSGSFAVTYRDRFGGGDGIAVESHTEPVTVAAEQGAVGVAAYVALLAATLLGLVAAIDRGRKIGTAGVLAFLLGAYVAMIIHSLGYAAFLTDPITWALLAVALALAGGSAATAPAHRPPGASPHRPPGRAEAAG